VSSKTSEAIVVRQYEGSYPSAAELEAWLNDVRPFATEQDYRLVQVNWDRTHGTAWAVWTWA
jgi:hypothetical protein